MGEKLLSNFFLIFRAEKKQLLDYVHHITDGLEKLIANKMFSFVFQKCNEKILEPGLEQLRLARKKGTQENVLVPRE